MSSVTGSVSDSAAPDLTDAESNNFDEVGAFGRHLIGRTPTGSGWSQPRPTQDEDQPAAARECRPCAVGEQRAHRSYLSCSVRMTDDFEALDAY
jgi:hypothetical protein